MNRGVRDIIHERIRRDNLERRRIRSKNKSKANRIQNNNGGNKKDREQSHKYFSSTYGFETIDAPPNFSLLVYPEDVIQFIKKIDDLYMSKKHIVGVKFDLKDIVKVDIGAICLLLSKLNELSKLRIRNCGTFPRDEVCKRFIYNSGFLDYIKDLTTGKSFMGAMGNNLIINRGFDKTDNFATAAEIRKAIKHITGSEGRYAPVYSIIQEMCSNSVEHANYHVEKKNWFLSSSYGEKSVTFTMTDIGAGILGTLKKKLSDVLNDSMRSNVDILENAFDKKYESRTGDINRNKGLPRIFQMASEGYIKNLIVVTNDVIFSFNDTSFSRKLDKLFNGTFYCWTLDNECIIKWKSRFVK